MKKIIVSLLFLFILIPVIGFASPFLISNQDIDLQNDAVFQIMINGVEQPEIYPIVEFAVKLDVQNYEGQKEIKARFGNPWPDIPDEYKWSDWSDPFNYAFPQKPGAPVGMVVSP